METDFESKLSQLEEQLSNAAGQERLMLHDRVQGFVSSLSAAGHNVPARLRRMHNRLADEAFEDMFDNMPV